MVEQSNAIVVANPIPAGLISEKLMVSAKERAAFMASGEWIVVFNKTTLSRIWCIGEVFPFLFF